MKNTFHHYRWFKFILPMAILVSLQGCVTALVGIGVATATQIATDPRTTGTQIDDESLENKITIMLQKDDEIKTNTHISVVSYDKNILLVGQVPNEQIKQRIQNKVLDIKDIKYLYNEIRIEPNTGIAQRSEDSWITAKIKSKLLVTENVSSNSIKVVTENGEVFLMGLVTPEQANNAVDVTRHIDGVKKVIKVFSYTE